MVEKINLNSEWITPYKTQRTIDFTATDYISTRNALISFIKQNAPENFNDYVANSELMILTSALSYISETMNYKTDMSLNDQFIDTTERVQSLMNFAKLVNYSVNRNHCSQGLLKIVEVSTDEELFDTENNSLKQIPIGWNDPSNVNWYDQFITVINSALVSNNKFNQPIGTITNNGISTDLYQIDSNITVSRLTYPFTAVVNGSSMSFEVVNSTFDNDFIVEATPKVGNANTILYNNDYNGLNSAATGFFVYFKQGSLKYQDIIFSENIQMQTVELNDININDEDVWVQEVDQNGLTLADWTAVKTPYNVIYNNEELSNRKIYQVITQLNDGVAIRFSDGKFGEIPYGNFRFWYRSSNGLSYSIRKSDIQNISITIPYVHSNTTSNEVYHLTLKLQLISDINNAIPSESKESTRLKIPVVNQTQNRMVTKDDYTDLPKVFTNQIKKLKVDNRVYAGHSTYNNSNDINPIKDVKIFSDKGVLHKQIEKSYSYEELPTKKTIESIVYSNIKDILNSKELQNFYYTQYPNLVWPQNPTWVATNSNEATQNGYFTVDDKPINVGSAGLDEISKLIIKQTLIKFKKITVDDNDQQFVWCRVLNAKQITVGATTYTGVEIDIPLTGEYVAVEILPPFVQTLTTDVVNQLIDIMDAKQTNSTSNVLSTYVGLCYDYKKQQWVCVDGQYLDLEGDFDISTLDDKIYQSVTAWLVLIKWSPTAWTFINRKVNYIFECQDVQFTQPIDTFIDLISLSDDTNFEITQLTTGLNNYVDEHSVQLKVYDFDTQNDPKLVDELLQDNEYIFYKKVSDSINEYVLTNVLVTDIIANITQLNQVYYVTDLDIYCIKTDIDTLYTYPEGEYKKYIGKQNIRFTWIHKTNKKVVVNPSPSSIIDMYVLTTNYYDQIVNWKQNNYDPNLYPILPTSAELSQTFAFSEDFKMLTDLIVWHPLKLKLLFGTQAENHLQAYIKVIPAENSLLSHGEIKQKILSAIDKFFNIDEWNFETTFNFPQLSTYIMQQMPYDIVSCVIVPKYSNLKFGNLYQIVFNKNEIPFSVATQQDIQIISSITRDNIRIGS